MSRRLSTAWEYVESDYQRYGLGGGQSKDHTYGSFSKELLLCL